MDKQMSKKLESQAQAFDLVDRNNFHQIFYEFKNILSKAGKKIIILNIIDSLNMNYSKLFEKINFDSFIKEDQSKLNEDSFFNEVYFPKVMERKNSQILFFEINILFENSDNQQNKNLFDSRIFLIPSLKFHKFISESYLNLNSFTFNFLNQNKSLFLLQSLLDISTLSYMPYSLENHLTKNFEKIKKYGKPTKNEFKKSYYFFPKGLNDPTSRIKKNLESFFCDLNQRLVKIKEEEKFHLDKLNKSKNNSYVMVEEEFFKDLFSVEKVLNFSYMGFFTKYDEKFLTIKFSKFLLKPFKVETQIFSNLLTQVEIKDLKYLKFLSLLLKKIFLDLQFLQYKLLSEILGKTNAFIDEFYKKVLKNSYENLNYISKSKKASIPPFILEDSFNELLENNIINERFFSGIGDVLESFADHNIIISMNSIDSKINNNNKEFVLHINYFLANNCSNKLVHQMEIIKYILTNLISFVDRSFIIFNNNIENNEINKKLKSTNLAIESFYNLISKNLLKIYLDNNLLKSSAGYESNIVSLDIYAFYRNILTFDLEEILNILKFYFEIDSNAAAEIEMSYSQLEKLECFFPENILKLYCPEYFLQLKYNIQYLLNVEPKKKEKESLTYDILFLKINKEKDILFDYDIETAIYKFLKEDLITDIKKNKQFDYFNFNKLNNEMRKFYTDLKNFLLFDEGSTFKKLFEENIFEGCLKNVTFTDKLNYSYSKSLIQPFLEKMDIEKNFLEKKNELLKLFVDTKSSFLKTEEFGLYNFVNFIFFDGKQNYNFNENNDNESNNNDLIITGFDINSIIIKIFHELYINHNITFKENVINNQSTNLFDNKLEDFKAIFKERFLSKNYLDLNILFNKKENMKKYKLEKDDFTSIFSFYYENSKLFTGRAERAIIEDNDTIKCITKNISVFFKNKIFLANHINTLSEFFKFIEVNNFDINKLFIAKDSSLVDNQIKIKHLQISNKGLIIPLSSQEQLYDLENIGNLTFKIQVNQQKQKILISFLEKFADFYVII